MGRQQVNFAATAVTVATMAFLTLAAESRDADRGLPPPLPTTRPVVQASIRVDARATGRLVSKYLTGACIEDVNHEIYGGIYSQMIFGESFQEPPAGVSVVKGFLAYGGEWRLVDGGVVEGPAGEGPKLVSSTAALF